jgi:tRNA pseudouridine38-40 synthase
MRIVAGVEYCGANFYGWQRQYGRRTVQECVEKALTAVANHPIQVNCAGRTDSGVHAIQQVIHFDTIAERENHSWSFGANSNLPDDININWVKPVTDEFHARFSAVSRRYRYFILNRRTRTALFKDLVTWEHLALDENKMVEAGKFLIGKHDFTSFRASACQAKTAVRNIIKLEIYREHDLVIIDIEANAFLHHMVRNIAGVLIMIGTGKHSPEWAREVLDAKDRSLGGVTANANGLYLVDIFYAEKFNIPRANGLTPVIIKQIF